MAALQLARRAALQLGEASAQAVLGQRSLHRLPLRRLVSGPRLPRPETPVASRVRAARCAAEVRQECADRRKRFISSFVRRKMGPPPDRRGARSSARGQQSTVEGARLFVWRSPPCPLRCRQGPRGRIRGYAASMALFRMSSPGSIAPALLGSVSCGTSGSRAGPDPANSWPPCPLARALPPGRVPGARARLQPRRRRAGRPRAADTPP